MTSPVEHYKFVTVFVIKDLFVDYHIYYYIVIEVLYLQWPMAVVAKKNNCLWARHNYLWFRETFRRYFLAQK